MLVAITQPKELPVGRERKGYNEFKRRINTSNR
jgi:hypothetical protein